VLVIVQQSGGNDGLNTIVPYTSSRYYKLRPTLAVHPNRVRPLDSTVGLNPVLKELHALW